MQQVLVKHKLVLEPSPRAGVLSHFAGDGQHSPLPLFGDLLRRPQQHGGEVRPGRGAAQRCARPAAAGGGGVDREACSGNDPPDA